MTLYILCLGEIDFFLSDLSSVLQFLYLIAIFIASLAYRNFNRANVPVQTLKQPRTISTFLSKIGKSKHIHWTLIYLGLQHCLNSLNNYCRVWGLNINTKKTQIMIFNKNQRNPAVNQDLDFSVGLNKLEVVKEGLISRRANSLFQCFHHKMFNLYKH